MITKKLICGFIFLFILINNSICPVNAEPFTIPDFQVMVVDEQVQPKEVEVAPVIVEKVNLISREIPTATSGSFKSFMDYRMITDKTSNQYELQKQAITSKDGFRMLDGRFMVAMGTYYAEEVGKMFVITLDSGRTFEVVVGDIKQDRHTDEKHQYGLVCNDIIEFIVDTDQISKFSMKMGSMMEFEGAIIKIEEMVGELK